MDISEVASESGLRGRLRDWGARLTLALGVLVAAFLALAGAGLVDRSAVAIHAGSLVLFASFPLLVTRLLRGRALDGNDRRGWSALRLAGAMVFLATALELAGDLAGSDGLSAAGDPVLLAGLVVMVRGLYRFRIAPSSRAAAVRWWLSAAIAFCGSSLMSWYFLVGWSARQPDGTGELLLTLIAPALLTALTLSVAVVLLQERNEALRGALGRIAAGLLLVLAVAWVRAATGFPLKGDPALWAVGGNWLGVLLIIAGVEHQWWHSRGVPPRAAPKSESTAWPALAPLVGVATGYAALLAAGFSQPDPRLRGLIAGVTVIAVLVLARQWVTLRDNRKLSQRLREEARTDPLTSLPNRRRLFEVADSTLGTAQRYGLALSVVAFDIDRFKEINDTFGHAIGDVVLRAVGGRCRASLRSTDLVARLGGDEFVVLLPNTTAEGAGHVAGALRARIAADPVVVGEQEVPIAISAGVATATPLDDFEQLLARADESLYAAKGRPIGRRADARGADGAPGVDGAPEVEQPTEGGAGVTPEGRARALP